METLFARLNVESLYAERFTSKKQAYAVVFECIEMFYNTVCRHSSNDYLSPNRYEENYYEMCE